MTASASLPRMPALRHLLVVLIVLVSSVGLAQVSATETTVATRALSIVYGAGQCPSPVQVEGALHRTDPSVQVVPAASRVPAASVLDEADQLRITTDKDRVIVDAARNCEERARSAALVLVLWLDYLRANTAPAPSLVLPPAPVVHSARWLRLARPLIERPLVLPRGAGEVQFEATIGTSSFVATPAGALPVGVAWAATGSFGVGGHTQLGFTTGVPFVKAGVEGGTFITRAQVELHRMVAMRFELGWDRFENREGATTLRSDGFFVSFTLPVKKVLSSKLALTALGGGAQRFEWIAAYGNGNYGLALPYSSQSLFSMRANSLVNQWGFFLPMGLIVQPHPIVAFYFQAGFRLALTDYDVNLSLSGIETSVDLVVSPVPFLDVGVSFETPITFSNAPGFLHGAVFARSRF